MTDINDELQYQAAVKETCDLLGYWLDLNPVWLYHVLITGAECDCNKFRMMACQEYATNAEGWYREFHGRPPAESNQLSLTLGEEPTDASI